jgi:hypothetical protein
VPPQPNSPPDTVISQTHDERPKPPAAYHQNLTHVNELFFLNQLSETTSRVVVFHRRFRSHLFYTS